MPTAKRWCFTLNNYSAAELDHIHHAYDDNSLDIAYLVAGREVGTSGTPHIQGFVVFRSRKSLGQLKSALSARLHGEICRGTTSQASDYCKKDGDYAEFGTLESDQGARTDWTDFTNWVSSLGRVPSDLETARQFPSLFARYHGACQVIAQAALPRPRLVPDGSTLRPWQQNLRDVLVEDCEDDRSILFYVDPEGNKGKSFFCRYMMQEYENRVQMLGVGRVTDIAYLINPEKDIFLIDCERSSSEFLQYRVLEQLKNRLVTSTKYTATVKVVRKIPHVVVFMNEEPDMGKLSEDRYIIEML